MGIFGKLKESLAKVGGGMLAGVFAGPERIDEDFYEELEEALIVADVGMETTEILLARLRQAVKEQELHTRSEARQAMVEILAKAMEPKTPFAGEAGPAVLLIVGVNGVGKTTSLGKLAHLYKSKGRNPLLAAGDTFRAAAAEQLSIWAERADTPIVKQGEGADPAAVVYDAICSYKAKGRDLLLVDTAGRLHNKKNLMEELRKIYRIIEREYPEAYLETLVVLDGTTGQNALAQARQFNEVANVTGIILTKLDGTAKGGIAVAIESELDIPVKYIGVGETIDDLQKFDSDEFVNALFNMETGREEA